MIGNKKKYPLFSVPQFLISKPNNLDLKVAIFEDNKTLRGSLTVLIAGSPGFDCTGSFADCRKVLNDIESSEPDVVLMDIDLPGVSGIEAVKMIKEKFPHIQILMQTVFDDDDKIFASICAGAAGYLLKKTPPVKILDPIKEASEGGAPMTPSVAARVLHMFQKQGAQTPVEFIDLSDLKIEE